MDTFKDSEKISLIRNYRSSQAILDSAYKLIQNNNPERFEVKAGIDKKVVALTGGGLPPICQQFHNNSSEADWVAQTIKDKVKDANFAYKDFAILVRSNSDAQPYLQALNMQGIPWQFSGNQGLYSRQEVKLCISFLRVVADCADSLSLYYLVSSEVYGFPLEDLSRCLHYAKRRNTSLYSVFKNSASIPDLAQLSTPARQKLDIIMVDLEKFLKLSRQETTGRLLYSFLTETGYLKKLTQDINLEKEAKIQNIAKFFSIVRDFELVAKEDRVINYVNYLDLLIEAGDDPETAEQDLDTDVVNVLTIHKAKGLEFRIVFLVTLVDGRFPVSRRRQSIELPDKLIKEILPEGDFHLQEERRLFYVGMTRAKEELYFTSAVDYGGMRLRRISQFVIEALGEKIKEEKKQKINALESIQRFAPAKESVKKRYTDIPEEQILNLSFYQIDDYLTCPLKYQYVHILRVPIMEHHTVIYGRAMHDAVTKYFQFKMAGKKWKLADLLNAFRENFDPQGFLSQKHQEERSRIGQEALVRFYAEEEKRNSSPLYIEKSFSFIFENNKIVGRFDRVDQEKDGAVIMDFKTSELNKQADADKRAKESLQLAIYALAYKQISKELPIRVELYFLESGLIGRAYKQESDLEKVKDKIREAAWGIRKRIFSAAAQYMSCTYCAYNQICQSAMIR
jgi:DNA helicase-2/ATP-dependent DNA helicase PcrA